MELWNIGWLNLKRCSPDKYFGCSRGLFSPSDLQSSSRPVLSRTYLTCSNRSQLLRSQCCAEQGCLERNWDTPPKEKMSVGRISNLRHVIILSSHHPVLSFSCQSSSLSIWQLLHLGACKLVKRLKVSYFAPAVLVLMHFDHFLWRASCKQFSLKEWLFNPTCICPHCPHWWCIATVCASFLTWNGHWHCVNCELVSVTDYFNKIQHRQFCLVFFTQSNARVLPSSQVRFPNLL